MKYQKQKYLLLKNLSEIGLLNVLVDYHGMIAGGAIRSVFARETIKDYDIYFKSKVGLSRVTGFIEDNDRFKFIGSTETADTYTCGGISIQLIKMPEFIREDPQEIINKFDFTVCMAVYDLTEDVFVLHELFLEHLSARELHINVDCPFPIATLFRVRKYLDKGYYIPGVELVKLGLVINRLRMKTFKDLRKQLMGIDTVFLEELTDALMTPEYAEKKYDFNQFLDMLSRHFEKALERVMVGPEEKEEEMTPEQAIRKILEDQESGE